MAPLFLFSTASTALLSFFLRAEAADPATCAYVQIVRKNEKGDSVFDYRAPGHCEKIIGGVEGARSRKFSCYSGCGGTKLQYQEFDDDECLGDMLEDKMLHRKSKEAKSPDRKWSTGPAGPETYMMDFDLGSVRDFDCSLAFCYVMEEHTVPEEGRTVKQMLETPDLRHVPADRLTCTKTQNEQYQWTKCQKDGSLLLFENEQCNVPQEPRTLAQRDSGKTGVHGVVRSWKCEGFDAVEEEETEFASHVLKKARMAKHKSAQSRRELAEAARMKREEKPGLSAKKVLILLAICLVPLVALIFRKYKGKLNGRTLKSVLPRRRPDGPKYTEVGQDDEAPLIL